MSDESSDSLKERLPLRRRTVMGALAASTGIGALGTASAQDNEDDDREGPPDWVPPEASEAHVAVLTGSQASVETNAGGCVHITTARGPPHTLQVDLVLEDIQCVTQAHIHEGERSEDGPVVAPLLEYTENLDGTGDGDPLTTRPDTPLIEGTTVEGRELVGDILANPEQYYVNVHTTHNPEGEIRGQIRGFDLGQETELEPVPAEFLVSDLDPVDVTVTQGDLIDVSATIRNAGDITATQTIEFRVDGDVVASQELELGCRESRTVTFEDIDTAALEPGDYEHGIFSEDDSETGTLTIVELAPAEFLVSDLDPLEATVTQGETIDVSATIENVGEQEGTQTIELRIDEELEAAVDPEATEFAFRDKQELTLDPSESETVVFEDVDTTPLEPGDYEHGIFSEDDFEIGSLTIEAPPTPAEFLVSDLDPLEATVTQGDLIDVSASIENVGEEDGTQSIALKIGEDIEEDVAVAFTDEQELTLEGGATETVTFEDVDTGALDPGEYEHGIFSEDDFETGTLTVEEELEPAEFLVSNLDPEDATVTQGDLINVSASIENVGEQEGTQTIELRIDEELEEAVDPEDVDYLFSDEQELTLGPDESETVVFEDVDTGALDPGDYEHGIFSEDDFETGTLTVEEEVVEPAEFLVSDLDPLEATVTQGDLIDVSASIENVGEQEGTQTIELRIDEELEAAVDPEDVDYLFSDEQELTLGPDESETVTFEDVDTGALDPGDYEHGIFSEDDFETSTLTVEEEEEEPTPAEFSVLDLDPEEATVAQGDLLDVEATIQNTGEEEGTQTVEFRVNGEVLDSEELTLEADETELVIFTDIDTTDLEPAVYAHGVFTDDDSLTGMLTVQEADVDPAEFTVSNLNPADVTVTQGAVIDVSAVIENVGGEAGTQTIEFRVDDNPIADQLLELDAGELETVVFSSIDTAVLEPGEYEHGIFSEDDSETATLTIEEEEPGNTEP